MPVLQWSVSARDEVGQIERQLPSKGAWLGLPLAVHTPTLEVPMQSLREAWRPSWLVDQTEEDDEKHLTPIT